MADIPESTKMKPCPFCGSGSAPYVHPTRVENWFGVTCDDERAGCGACIIADGRDQAVAAWNTRPAPPAMDREAVLEALELADATLRGANMDRAFVERKVTAAITGLKSTSTVPADTMVILHALLTEYAGQPNQAGEAYKLVDATLSADAIRQGEGFKWPEPTFLPVDGGAKLNPERVKAAFELINGELVIGEQFQLIEMMLDGTEYTVVPASHASDGGKA